MEELSTAKRKNKYSDSEVTRALYNRALGITISKKKEVFLVRPEGELVKIKEESQKEEVPPDVKAAIFWLKNRKPEAWREGQEINVESDGWVDALKAIVAKYPPEE